MEMRIKYLLHPTKLGGVLLLCFVLSFSFVSSQAGVRGKIHIFGYLVNYDYITLLYSI